MSHRECKKARNALTTVSESKLNEILYMRITILNTFYSVNELRKTSRF